MTQHEQNIYFLCLDLNSKCHVNHIDTNLKKACIPVYTHV